MALMLRVSEHKLLQVDGTPGSNDLPSRLVFATLLDGAASATERLRIDSSGRLLLACTTPPNTGVNAGLQIQHTRKSNITLARNDSSIWDSCFKNRFLWQCGF